MKFKSLFFYFLISLSSFAQNDTITESIEKWDDGDFVVEQIDFEKPLIDSRLIPVDIDSSIKQRKFPANYKDEYENNSAFKYSYENKSDLSFFQRIKKSIKDFFYEILNPKSIVSKTYLFEILKLVSILFFILFLGYIIYRFAKGDYNKFWIKKAKDIMINSEDIEKNIHQINFKDLIAQTVSKNNYRLAVRYYYLWTLKRLSVAEIIQWHPEKTNAVYVNEIKNETLRIQFQYLSYIYSNIWYGEFTIDEADFNKAQQAFLEILKQYPNE